MNFENDLTTNADQLFDWLTEQMDLLDHLVVCGQRQCDAIATQRINELLAILGEKQPMLDRLMTLRTMIVQSQSLIQSDAFWPSAGRREQCRVLRDNVATRFQILIDLESQCETDLNTNRLSIRQQIDSLDSGRTAANAYQSQSTPSPRIDFTSIG